MRDFQRGMMSLELEQAYEKYFEKLEQVKINENGMIAGKKWIGGRVDPLRRRHDQHVRFSQGRGGLFQDPVLLSCGGARRVSGGIQAAIPDGRGA